MGNINLIKKENKDMKFFFFEEKYFTLLNKILSFNYKTLQEFKNDNRTYVAKILIDDKYYILKKIFIRKKIKKILSLFKKGEGLSTLLNIQTLKKQGVEELADILGVAVERKNGMITNEIILMEYCEGKRAIEDENLLKVLPILDKIYLLGRFHGDCNPGNFLLNDKEEVKILDTKLKKMFFGNYRKHYDILTLMKHFKNKIEYPYRKNIFYYLAASIRKFRDMKNILRRKV